MTSRPYIVAILIFLFGLVPAYARAAVEVGGSILYGAGEYHAEVDGQEVSRIKSQYGQASLFSEAKGLLGSERLGKYRLMLGYEFNIIDPTVIENGVKDPDTQRIDTGKVLYQGEFLLAPGGLPFRVSAYARDTKLSSFQKGLKQPSLPVGLQSGWDGSTKRSLVSNDDVITDINNGTKAELGFTALIGIRNGSYLGAYRDVLAQLPRLLIDYKQIEVEDLSFDSDMDHYRERDLAFISLNKKDNWIHVRRNDYVDYLDQTQNFERSQLMIGTIDHSLTRQWINMTNWIKVSGDLSYTSEQWRYKESPEHTYNVNLFAVAQRPETKVSVLSSFERTTQDEYLKQTLDLPVTLYYEPNRESIYRGNFHAQQWSQSLLDGTMSENTFWEQKRRSAIINLNSEFNRTRAVVFRPGMNLEVRDNDDSQGMSEKLTLEWSKRKGFDPLLWTAGYYIASSQTSNDASSSTAVYSEQSLYGNMERSLNRAIRVGLRARVRYGSGSSENSVTEDVTDKVSVGTVGGVINKEDVDRFLAYHGLVFLDHVGEIFFNRIEFMAEGIDSDVDRKSLTELRHELQVQGRTSRFTLTSTLAHGTEIEVRSVDMDYVEEVSNQGSDFGWSTKARYIFDPDRSMRLTLLASARGVSDDEESNRTWTGTEKLEYRFYTSRGRVRKLAEVYEEIGVEGTTESLSGRDRTLFLRFSGAIFPTDYFYAKITSDLVVFPSSDSMQLTGAVETGLTYDKFQVSLGYGRGYKEAEGLLAKVMEERWNLKVKKTF